MRSLTRRRFLSITAAATALAAGGAARAGHLRQWRGTALGARAAITLAHADGERIAKEAFAEIDRLEDIFSLYRTGSALSRLNKAGELPAPPLELLECLTLSGSVHRATGGLFDPTVQPLWELYARSYAAGAPPETGEIDDALEKVGWEGVSISSGAVTLRPGMALTLNGIAQGYIADRIAALLRARGLTDVLVDTGEHHAVGGKWPVMVSQGDAVSEETVKLRDLALATSAPLGTVFDAEGKTGHILDPHTGLPANPQWRIVSVTASRAALADSLSTAMVLMNRKAMTKALEAIPGAALVAAGPAVF